MHVLGAPFPSSSSSERVLLSALRPHQACFFFLGPVVHGLAVIASGKVYSLFFLWGGGGGVSC